MSDFSVKNLPDASTRFALRLTINNLLQQAYIASDAYGDGWPQHVHDHISRVHEILHSFYEQDATGDDVLLQKANTIFGRITRRLIDDPNPGMICPICLKYQNCLIHDCE